VNEYSCFNLIMLTSFDVLNTFHINIGAFNMV